MTTNRARQWHALTAVVATAALVLQLVLASATSPRQDPRAACLRTGRTT